MDVFGDLVGTSLPLKKVIWHLRNLAGNDLTTLISGETGTGKELAARAIHQFSRRSDKPFLAINCGSLPEGLLESELFGHEGGAFTGAQKKKDGLFLAAQGGTLLLDEIETATPSTQVALLRVIDRKEVLSVGGQKPVPIDVRILVTTNRDLKEMIDENFFREDLFYRITQSQVEMPPLKKRKGDIPILIEKFLSSITGLDSQGKRQFSQESLDLFQKYSWPGNVRELKNVVLDSVFRTSKPIIKPSHLSPNFPKTLAIKVPKRSITEQLREKKSEAVLQALQEVNFNKSRAAKLLGIARTSLLYFMKRHNIAVPAKT